MSRRVWVMGSAKKAQEVDNSGVNSETEKPRGKGGNPILQQWKETGVLPEGYEKNPKGGIRKVPPLAVDPATADVDRFLAMKFVLINPAACDTTEIQKWCREWLSKRPAEFMSRYDELEREREAKMKPATEKPVAEVQSDRDVRELISRLLERHLEESRP